MDTNRYGWMCTETRASHSSKSKNENDSAAGKPHTMSCVQECDKGVCIPEASKQQRSQPEDRVLPAAGTNKREVGAALFSFSTLKSFF